MLHSKETRPARRSAIPRLIEFFVLLTVGMLGWFLCSPVLPIPSDKHLRAISIALAEMLFLVGLGCLAARRPGFAPSALGRRFAAVDPAPGLAEIDLCRGRCGGRVDPGHARHANDRGQGAVVAVRSPPRLRPA